MRTTKGPKSSEDGGLYAALLRYLDDAPNWGHAKADEMTSEGSRRRDPMRHMMASSEIVQELKNDRGYPGPLAALVANTLGLGHEISNFHGLRSMGEDVLNNFIGSIPAAVMDDPEKIDKMIEMLSYFTPDGKDETEDDYDEGGNLGGGDPPESPFTLEELIRQMFGESRFNPRAVSPAGAAGLAQIMPDTRDWMVGRYNLDPDIDVYDPESARMMQKRYMEDLFGREWNKGSDEVRKIKALAAYNYGPTNTLRMLERAKKAGYDIYNDTDFIRDEELFPKETRDYVNRIFFAGDPEFEDEYSRSRHKYFDLFPEAQSAVAPVKVKKAAPVPARTIDPQLQNAFDILARDNKHGGRMRVKKAN